MELWCSISAGFTQTILGVLWCSLGTRGPFFGVFATLGPIKTKNLASPEPKCKNSLQSQYTSDFIFSLRQLTGVFWTE